MGSDSAASVSRPLLHRQRSVPRVLEPGRHDLAVVVVVPLGRPQQVQRVVPGRRRVEGGPDGLVLHLRQPRAGRREDAACRRLVVARREDAGEGDLVVPHPSGPLGEGVVVPGRAGDCDGQFTQTGRLSGRCAAGMLEETFGGASGEVRCRWYVLAGRLVGRGSSLGLLLLWFVNACCVFRDEREV